MNIQSNTPATSLRQRMIEDMVARNLGPHSRRSHLASCKRFAAFQERSHARVTDTAASPIKLYTGDGIAVSNQSTKKR